MLAANAASAAFRQGTCSAVCRPIPNSVVSQACTGTLMKASAGIPNLPTAIRGRVSDPQQRHGNEHPHADHVHHPTGIRLLTGQAEHGVSCAAHWCTILVSAFLDRASMHPGCRQVTALLA